MSFGLTQTQLDILNNIFNDHLKTGEVIVYGSRAKDTYNDRSDIDLVIKHSSDNYQTLMDIEEAIAESDFPYLCDINFYNTIKNADLIAHIDSVGQVLWQR